MSIGLTAARRSGDGGSSGRHLDSPLDSLLKLTDANGKQLMINDDFEDLDRDSRHITRLAAARGVATDGSFFIHLGIRRRGWEALPIACV